MDVLVLLFGLFFLGGPILLVVVLVRLNGLKGEVDLLRAEMRTLRGSVSARMDAPRRDPDGAPEPLPERATGPAPPRGPATDSDPERESRSSTATPAAPTPARPPAATEAAAPPKVAMRAPAPFPGSTAAPSKASTVASTSGAPSPRAKALEVDWKRWDWERWLGIRGAAVVGGIALIFAGLFFVQVAIERGWLGPTARDLLAFGIGAVALAAQRPLRRRDFGILGDSVGGAGTVLMYGAAWAAARLHELVPVAVALTVMAGVTMTALALAARSKAPILAAFAIAGGFATPILLDTLGGSAAGLFGYIVVLDLCLLALARLRSWRAIAPAALIGTTLLQWAWIETHGWSTEPWFFVGMLGGFTGLFCVALTRDPGSSERSDPVLTATLFASLGLPFVFLLRGGLELGATGPIWPVVVLSAVLCSGAAWIARKGTTPGSTALYLPMAAAGSAATLAWWTIRRRLGAPEVADTAWTHWALSSLGLCVLLLWLARSARERLIPFCFALFALLAAQPLTLARLAAVATGDRVETAIGAGLFGFDLNATFVGAIAALSTIALLAGSRSPWPKLAGGGVGLAAGLALAFRYDTTYARTIALDDPLPWAAVGIGVCATIVGLALPALRAHWRRRAESWGTAGLFVALPMFLSTVDREANAATVALAALLAVAVAFGISGQGRHSTSTVLAAIGAALAAVLVEINWSQAVLRHHVEFDVVQVGLAAFVLIAVLPLTAAAIARTADSPVLRSSIAWITSAPAAALVLQPSGVAAALGDSADLGPLGAEHVVLLVGAAVLAGSGALLWHRTRDRLGVMPHFAVAAALVSVCAARLFAEQWTTVAAALIAGSWAMLAGRAGSAHQRILATGIAVLSAAVLLAVTFIARAFAAEDFFLPLQLTIDYGLVLAGLALAALSHRSVDPAEGRAAGRIALTASTLAVGFGWMNAAVLNKFATGERIEVELARMQARDLTLSIAWAVFGGTLLAVGLARKNPGLRWTSLALFVSTIFKVFLYDLGALSGLSRVGSFLGLAVALMGVSVVYARVLGREDGQPPAAGDTLPGDAADHPTTEPLP